MFVLAAIQKYNSFYPAGLSVIDIIDYIYHKIHQAVNHKQWLQLWLVSFLSQAIKITVMNMNGIKLS